jgi:hypothetical protein
LLVFISLSIVGQLVARAGRSLWIREQFLNEVFFWFGFNFVRNLRAFITISLGFLAMTGGAAHSPHRELDFGDFRDWFGQDFSE